MMNQLQKYLLVTEFDGCNLIKEENEIITFDCYNEFEEQNYIIECVPFTNDDQSKGYTLYHQGREMTVIHESEL